MGGITNPVHLMFIAVIALIVLGPKRLPDLARSLGSGMREFRESLTSATSDEPALPAAGETVHARAHAEVHVPVPDPAAPGETAHVPVPDPAAPSAGGAAVPPAPAAPPAPHA